MLMQELECVKDFIECPVCGKVPTTGVVNDQTIVNLQCECEDGGVTVSTVLTIPHLEDAWERRCIEKNARETRWNRAAEEMGDFAVTVCHDPENEKMALALKECLGWLLNSDTPERRALVREIHDMTLEILLAGIPRRGHA